MRILLSLVLLQQIFVLIQSQTNETGLGCFGLPMEPTTCNCEEMFCSIAACTVRRFLHRITSSIAFY
jgi:hypothetical protein